MASLDDILPKSFVINIKGVELECRPPKLSHVMLLAKTSKVFQDLDNASVEQIQEVQKTVDAVFEELIPELKGKSLDMDITVEVITQIMENVQPSDNKELADRGVSFNADPKVQTNPTPQMGENG